MKQGELSTWLKTVIIFLAVIICVTVVYIGPNILEWRSSLNPELAYIYPLGMVTLISVLIPIIIALVFSWIICCEIKKNNSFSMKNSNLLKYIAICAIIDSVIFFISILTMFLFKSVDLTILVINFILLFSSIFAAVLMAVLSHLTEKAAQLKAENDLTI